MIAYRLLLQVLADVQQVLLLHADVIHVGLIHAVVVLQSKVMTHYKLSNVRSAVFVALAVVQLLQHAQLVIHLRQLQQWSVYSLMFLADIGQVALSTNLLALT